MVRVVVVGVFADRGHGGPGTVAVPVSCVGDGGGRGCGEERLGGGATRWRVHV